MIDPNGVITWTPGEDQGPGAYPITVHVTDIGNPPLTNARTFTIIVNEANLAPILTALEDQTIQEGQETAFPVIASDADVPLQKLTYSLDAEPPAGALLDALTGAFSWTPSSSQAPSTNLITVRVSDDGTPSLSDAHTFRIVVEEKPLELRLSQVRLTGDERISFVWSTRPGRTYRVQFKQNLSESGWSDLEPTITAAGASLSFTHSLLGKAQCFYRVIRLD
jgi:hypothetical protein